MSHNKRQRHEAIRERAADAIRNLYHNATPRYPSLEGEECEAFESWFSDAAQFEIEYIQDGGAYGRNYEKTLRAECNAGRFKSERARNYYVRMNMRKMREERARCNTLDSRSGKLTNAQWERISEFGKLYQYGRGGRTLAPEGLMSRHCNAGPLEDYAAEMSIADCVDLIRIVESFNAYVAAWCAGVPEQWAEYWRETCADMDRELEPTE